MLGKILIAMVVMLLILVGGVAYLFFQSQQPPAMIASLPTIVPSKEADSQLDQKLKDLDAQVEEARRTGVKRDVQLVVTQEELTSRVNRVLTAEKSGDASVSGVMASENVTNLQVHVTNDSIIGSAKVNVQGIEVPVAAQVRVDTSGDQPQLIIQNVDMGNVPLPAAVKDQVNQAIAGKADISKMNLPVDLKNVKIENGQLVIQGQTK